MKAQEVRIGNLISWISTGRLEEVLKIDIKYVNDVNQSDLKPIPLTEDWLVRFGFDVKENTSWSSGNEQMFRVYSKGNLTYNSIQGLWWFGGKVLSNQPESVHQLQNLFLALTGDELPTDHCKLPTE